MEKIREILGDIEPELGAWFDAENEYPGFLVDSTEYEQAKRKQIESHDSMVSLKVIPLTFVNENSSHRYFKFDKTNNIEVKLNRLATAILKNP